MRREMGEQYMRTCLLWISTHGDVMDIMEYVHYHVCTFPAISRDSLLNLSMVVIFVTNCTLCERTSIAFGLSNYPSAIFSNVQCVLDSVNILILLHDEQFPNHAKVIPRNPC